MRTLLHLLLPGIVATRTSIAADLPLWVPSQTDTWQIILSSQLDLSVTLSPNVTIFDIDGEIHTKEAIDTLHEQGKKVICYFSAGSYEPNRIDSERLEGYTGKTLNGWPDERWLDVRREEVRDIMKDRIGRMKAKGCDAVYPDNVDGYDNDNGLALTSSDAVSYVQFLANESTSLGMSIGLKNAQSLIPSVLDFVHFAVNEQCEELGECDVYTSSNFVQQGKPVFNIEYVDAEGRKHPARCPGLTGFQSVIKKMNLDGWVRMCDGSEYATATNSSSQTPASSDARGSGDMMWHGVPGVALVLPLAFWAVSEQILLF